MKLMAIDGNSILNRAFYGVRLLTNHEGLFTNAVYGFLSTLFKLQDEHKPDRIVVCFDVREKTFRHKEYAEYKGTRKGMPDELAQQLPLIREVLDAMGIPYMEKAGFEANIIENHDQPRGASLFIPEEDYGFYSLSALAMIMLCQRGLPFLYQGQEIGMSNRRWEYAEFNDLETINQYHIAREAGMSEEQALKIASHHSRDNARTPMQWNHDENAGFSTEKPWMPVNENYKIVNVKDDEKEYGSILNFYKRLIAFRKSGEYNEILTYGDFKPMYEEEYHIFAYSRSYGDQKLVLICNFSSEGKSVELLEDYESVVFVNYEQTTVIGNRLQMKPYECVVYEKR